MGIWKAAQQLKSDQAPAKWLSKELFGGAEDAAHHGGPAAGA